jgi:hypothetical protein
MPESRTRLTNMVQSVEHARDPSAISSLIKSWMDLISVSLTLNVAHREFGLNGLHTRGLLGELDGLVDRGLAIHVVAR